MSPEIVAVKHLFKRRNSLCGHPRSHPLPRSEPFPARSDLLRRSVWAAIRLIASFGACVSCAAPHPFSPPPACSGACRSVLFVPQAHAQSNTNAEICANTNEQGTLFAGAAHLGLRRAHRYAEGPAAGIGHGARQSRRDLLVHRQDAAGADRFRPRHRARSEKRAGVPQTHRSLPHHGPARQSARRRQSSRCNSTPTMSKPRWTGAANIFNNNGQYDRAIADYNEALRVKPDDAQTLIDRGAATLLLQEGLSIGDHGLQRGHQD